MKDAFCSNCPRKYSRRKEQRDNHFLSIILRGLSCISDLTRRRGCEFLQHLAVYRV